MNPREIILTNIEHRDPTLVVILVVIVITVLIAVGQP